MNDDDDRPEEIEARAECAALRARVADREHELIRARAERDALRASFLRHRKARSKPCETCREDAAEDAATELADALRGIRSVIGVAQVADRDPELIRVRADLARVMNLWKESEHDLIRVRAELAEARAERDAALAALVAIEWMPQRTLAGTEALFCPACRRPQDEPAHLRALNIKHGGIRDDGHRRDCPLALALDAARGEAP